MACTVGTARDLAPAGAGVLRVDAAAVQEEEATPRTPRRPRTLGLRLRARLARSTS
jgi:hypothetical protein